MEMFTPHLNLPTRKTKGLIKLFAGISAGFYHTNSVVAEGTPMVPVNTLGLMRPAVKGDADGPKVFGLALQDTYDDSTWGQLRGYHFANDTRQRLDGQPIGLLCGAGWGLTLNYWGVIAYGDTAAVGASGRLEKHSNVEGDKLPIVFEAAGTNGNTLVRIRFDFPVAPQVDHEYAISEI